MEFHPLIVAAAFAFMVIASVSDYRHRKITNQYNLVGTISGLSLQFALVGTDGVVAGLWGFGVGLGILFIPFALGMIGGGDVKFVAASGTFLGPQVLLLGLVAGMILGGVGAVISIARSGRFASSVETIRTDMMSLSAGVRPTTLKTTQAVETVPYGIALALGMAGALTATLLRWV